MTVLCITRVMPKESEIGLYNNYPVRGNVLLGTQTCCYLKVFLLLQKGKINFRGVLPMMAYTGRLRQKGVWLFQASDT